MLQSQGSMPLSLCKAPHTLFSSYVFWFYFYFSFLFCLFIHLLWMKPNFVPHNLSTTKSSLSHTACGHIVCLTSNSIDGCSHWIGLGIVLCGQQLRIVEIVISSSKTWKWDVEVTRDQRVDSRSFFFSNSSIVYIIEPRMLMHVFFCCMFVTTTPYHIPLKYRCPTKKSGHINVHVPYTSSLSK